MKTSSKLFFGSIGLVVFTVSIQWLLAVGWKESVFIATVIHLLMAAFIHNEDVREESSFQSDTL